MPPIAPGGRPAGPPCNVDTPNIGDMPLLFGVIGRTLPDPTDEDDLPPTPINGDSRLDRESIVRGDALGDGIAAGKYGL